MKIAYILATLLLGASAGKLPFWDFGIALRRCENPDCKGVVIKDQKKIEDKQCKTYDTTFWGFSIVWLKHMNYWEEPSDYGSCTLYTYPEPHCIEPPGGPEYTADIQKLSTRKQSYSSIYGIRSVRVECAGKNEIGKEHKRALPWEA